MNISGPLSRLRLYNQVKGHQRRHIQKTSASTDDKQIQPVKRERRRQKDRRQRNIRVLLNRRQLNDRRKQRSPSDNGQDRKAGHRINTRA